MLDKNPNQRPNAFECLQHDWFKSHQEYIQRLLEPYSEKVSKASSTSVVFPLKSQRLVNKSSTDDVYSPSSDNSYQTTNTETS